MGLDVSHDCWSGSYPIFHRWRTKIAQIMGIPLRYMEGFYSMDWYYAIDWYVKCDSFNEKCVEFEAMQQKEKLL